MDLSIYNVIQGPWVTEKAYLLNNNLKHLVLRVHPKSNKIMIKEALEKLFNVKVDDVHIVVNKGKMRRVGRHAVKGKGSKKAIIRLKPGYMIDVMGSQAPQSVEPVAPEKVA